ncbi:MAG: GNAT family N-acetyltransferase, partial [Bdellovibrionales bacterium]
MLSKTELLTERTRSVLPGPELAQIVLNHFLENREHFKPTYPPLRDDFYTLDNFEGGLVAAHESADDGRDFKFFIFDRHDPKKILGGFGLSQVARGPFQACYLGYSAAKSAEGKGLMFEALSRAIEFAFNDLHIHRLMANHMPDNHRSSKLLQRLGFQVDGLAKNYLFINGEWRDHVL